MDTEISVNIINKKRETMKKCLFQETSYQNKPKNATVKACTSQLQQLKASIPTVDASPRHDCDLDSVLVNDKNRVQEMELENSLGQTDLFKTHAPF